jgi:mono/diheme cytochrome c family protein
MIIHKKLQTLLLFTILFAAIYGQSSADDGAARKLLNSQGCKACHALEGDGGKIALSFEEMRQNLSRIDIRLKLYNQSGTHGNSGIPDFAHLTEEELDELVNFIQPQQ